MARVRWWLNAPVLRRSLALAGVLAAVLTVIAVAFGDETWSTSAAYGVIWVTALALVVRLGAGQRRPRRHRMTYGPSLALWAVAVVVPDWAVFFVGAGVGWMLIADVVLSGRVRMEYQAAVRAMRRGAYDEAVRRLDAIIAADPDNPEHWCYRAELRRMAGDPRKAVVDYRRAAKLAPDDVDALVGLAEVYAQQGEYERAQDAAERAANIAPADWRPAYDLGMIADRRGDASDAARHLEDALQRRTPARFTVLARLWLARSYHRLGRDADAGAQVDLLRHEEGPLREWKLMLASEHAALLRTMVGADIALAEQLVDGKAPLAALDGGSAEIGNSISGSC